MSPGADELLATIRKTVNDWADIYRAARGYAIDPIYLSSLSNDIAWEITTPPNARLIAAAPELYQALERIVELANYLPWSTDEEDAILDIASAALAKARGETPIQEDAGTSPKSAGDR